MCDDDSPRFILQECFQKGVEITPGMTHQLQLALTAAGVDFVVAPYEADVQLAYMSLKGLVDCVVTEDSDLIVCEFAHSVFRYCMSRTNASTSNCCHCRRFQTGAI